jgi:anti-sigma regulatory factor (Ser/Thr protein kinase)
MGLKKTQREILKRFIIENVKEHPHDIVAITAGTFGISRQGVHVYIKKLIDENILISEGKTNGIKYELKEEEYDFAIEINENASEDEVWRTYVQPILPEIEKNIHDICYYAFTEMFNNVIDHSESDRAKISIRFNAVEINFLILDYGVGIFNKIQKSLHLKDPRHAILELAKGKCTTDEKRHTGEGIYFTSRMCDGFDILSEKLYFHGQKNRDLLADKDKFNKGTAVFMDINRDSDRTLKQVFDSYFPTEDDYGFSRTIVPVKLLKHEGEELISRSQAKRLITRFDKFKEVVLDFEGVKMIGQPFADEVFRVFQVQNSGVYLRSVNTSEEIERMIKHVLGNL